MGTGRIIMNCSPPSYLTYVTKLTREPISIGICCRVPFLIFGPASPITRAGQSTGWLHAYYIFSQPKYRMLSVCDGFSCDDILLILVSVNVITGTTL